MGTLGKGVVQYLLILLTVVDFLAREPSKSAVDERWISPANVERQPTARPAGNGARKAEGVVGPMSSTRRKRAKQTSAQSAENPQ